MRKKIIAILLLSCITLGLLSGCTENVDTEETVRTDKPIVTSTPISSDKEHPVSFHEESIRVAASYAEVLDVFSNQGNSLELWEYWDEEKVNESTEASSDGTYTGTNIQVTGYDEADLVKTNGEYIYILGPSDLKVFHADRENSALIGSVDIVQEAEDEEYSSTWTDSCGLFLWQNIAAVIQEQESYDAEQIRYRTICNVLLYDVSNHEAPKYIGSFAQDGTYQAARLVDGFLYLVTSDYRYRFDEDIELSYIPCTYQNSKVSPISHENIYICPNSDRAFSIAGAIDLASSESVDALAFTDSCDCVYMDDTGLYLLRSYSDDAQSEPYQEDQYSVCNYEVMEFTEVKKLSFDKGTLSLVATNNVPGRLYGQYGVDVYDGYFRIATSEMRNSYRIFTDEKHGWSNYEWGDSYEGNSLFILNEDLQSVGALTGFGENESIYAVRFIEQLGYVITYEQIDPLFAIDLSDPTSPQIKDSLKIEGVSYYLHLYEPGKLFGLGREGDSLKAVMFDVQDINNISAESVLMMEQFYFSEALYNPRAFLISQEKGILAFPAESSYVLLGYEAEGLLLRGEIQLGTLSDDARGVLIDDTLYVCDSAAVTAVDANTAELLNTFEFGVG